MDFNSSARSVIIPGDISFYVDNIEIYLDDAQSISLIKEASRAAEMYRYKRTKILDEIKHIPNNLLKPNVVRRENCEAELARMEQEFVETKHRKEYIAQQLANRKNDNRNLDELSQRVDVYNVTRLPLTVSTYGGVTTSLNPLMGTGDIYRDLLHSKGFPKDQPIKTGVYYRVEFSISAGCLMRTKEHFNKKNVFPGRNSIEEILCDYMTNRWNSLELTDKVRASSEAVLREYITHDFCSLDAVLTRWLKRETAKEPVFRDVFFIYIPETEIKGRTVFEKRTGLVIADEEEIQPVDYHPITGNEDNIVTKLALGKLSNDDSVSFLNFVSNQETTVYIRMGNKIIPKLSRKPNPGEELGMTISLIEKKKGLEEETITRRFPLRTRDPETNALLDKELAEFGIFYRFDDAEAYLSDNVTKVIANEASREIAKSKEKVANMTIEKVTEERQIEKTKAESEATTAEINARIKTIELESRLVAERYKTEAEQAKVKSARWETGAKVSVAALSVVGSGIGLWLLYAKKTASASLAIGSINPLFGGIVAIGGLALGICKALFSWF